jgi:hypothetical protein
MKIKMVKNWNINSEMLFNKDEEAQERKVKIPTKRTIIHTINDSFEL